MSRFSRGLSPQTLDVLDKMAASSSPNWWQDLLSAWVPSGSPGSGARTLRLAIRDNYLNFYRNGQSVARVSVNRAGNPVLTTHIKYHLEGLDRSAQAYLAIVGEELRYPKGVTPGPDLRYAPSLLEQWTRRSLRYQGMEKAGVEDVVAGNASVIDLEMGLPAWPGQVDRSGNATKVAPRMDLVALEDKSGVPRVVFWEAKTIGDSRLRSRKAGAAEVLWQLQQYRTYLAERDRYLAVAEGYQTVCKLLVRLHETARKVPGATSIPDLTSIVRHVGSSQALPEVDLFPRLLIFHGTHEKRGMERAPRTWPTHRAALGDVHAIYQQDPRLIRL